MPGLESDLTQSYPDDPFLRGAFEPIRFECDYSDLVIEGDLPTDLAGRLYRIGPNPQHAPRGPYNPLLGDGMVHAFRFAGGRVAYRNRWVRTRRWTLERKAGRALFATADPRDNDPAVAGETGEGAANTHIISHAGRLLALEEGHPPVELNPETLETMGPFDFGGRLPRNMTAHPKVDPETGEMLFFANAPSRRFDGRIAVYTANRGGELVRTGGFQGPYPALVHDFAITRRHLVFILSPVTLSLARLREGASAIAWEPELGAFVGVMPRGGDGAEMRWFQAPPCMVWHTLNAFDDGARVHIDLCQQDAPAFPPADGSPISEAALRQHLFRWTVDLGSDAAVQIRQLAAVLCEYPRIDERFCGLPYRYGFVAAEGGPGTPDPSHRAIARYDHATGRTALWRAPPGQAVSEPVFVARSNGAPEGVGHLLATVFDERRNASYLAILDAQSVEQGPIARACLDHRIPAGFHGSWVPESWVPD
jgi:carotenoid cleavage dioxygenase